MREDFAACDRIVLVYEGGKVNNPKDPGGRTNQGVTQRVYDGWRRRKALPLRSVYLMEGAERDDIYRNQFWAPIRGDDLPAGVDLVVYDGAVNSGPVQAVKWLQRALADAGLYRGGIDGHIGEGTLAAIEQHTDMAALIRAICARRLAFMKALHTWATFGKGWAHRVADVQAGGLKLMAGAPHEACYADGCHAKAALTDAKAAPQTALADTSAGGGMGVATITQATTTIQPLVDQSHTIALIFSGLTALGVILTIGGLLWGIYARNRRAALHDALDIAPARTEPAANDNAAEDAPEEREAA